MKTKRLRQAAAGLSVLALLALTVYALRFPQEVRCYALPLSRMERLAERVYVHPQMPEADRQSLLSAIEKGRERIRFFWGEQKAEPTLVAGPKATYELYGSDLRSPGMSHATPFGAYLVLGPDGIDSDVVAHELCHAELLARIGWRARSFEVPVWFDEGLALTFDYRFNHSEAMWLMATDGGKNVPTLEDLESRADFNAYTRQSPYLSYVTAKKEVFRWMSVVGIDGLFALIEKLRGGANFEETYDALEREAKASESE